MPCFNASYGYDLVIFYIFLVGTAESGGNVISFVGIWSKDKVFDKLKILCNDGTG